MATVGSQISLFDYDFMQEESKPEYPPIIEELDKDLTLLFIGLITRDKSYEVWDHVPNLGKRYKLWVDVREEDTVKIKDINLEPIIEKYKAKQLEVSISSTGSLKDGISHSLMISTMWLTNGHKEVWDD